jgi:hypothetical protein
MQRVAKQFGVGSGSLFDKARVEGQSIADRGGYGKTPCAEVQSAVLQRAFARAGVHGEFEGTSLVTDLNRQLASLGWSVWDPKFYIPTPGAIGMHARGISPSHTYLIAGLPEDSDQQIPAIGEDFGAYAGGRYILDNASAKGIDLRILSKSEIEKQYNTGAFWLPPGVIPLPRKK